MLSRRAGKLIIGFDAAVEAIKKQLRGGVVTTSDLSPKTEKEVLYYASRYGVETLKLEFTMDEANKALGKRAGVFFVKDEGLFGSIKKNIRE